MSSNGKSEQVIQIGLLKFSWRQVIIGIESALLVAPINILIVFLFQKGTEKTRSESVIIVFIIYFILCCVPN